MMYQLAICLFLMTTCDCCLPPWEWIVPRSFTPVDCAGSCTLVSDTWEFAFSTLAGTSGNADCPDCTAINGTVQINLNGSCNGFTNVGDIQYFMSFFHSGGPTGYNIQFNINCLAGGFSFLADYQYSGVCPSGQNAITLTLNVTSNTCTGWPATLVLTAV